MADYFEDCLRTETPQGLPPTERAKMVANWLLGEFSRLLNATNTEINDSKVGPAALFDLVQLVSVDSVSGASAKLVFEEMFNTGKQAADIIAQRGLSQISDSQEIRLVINKVLSTNTQAVSDYTAGKTQALTFLVGQVMRATRGRANPKLVSELLKKKLEKE